jgi:hypothetical protein
MRGRRGLGVFWGLGDVGGSVTLVRMSETPNDPAGTTHQFQNFAAQAPAEQPKKMNTGLIAGIAAVVVLVVVVAVALWMIM